jgi:hypothetical protein
MSPKIYVIDNYFTPQKIQSTVWGDTLACNYSQYTAAAYTVHIMTVPLP